MHRRRVKFPGEYWLNWDPHTCALFRKRFLQFRSYFWYGGRLPETWRKAVVIAHNCRCVSLGSLHARLSLIQFANLRLPPLSAHSYSSTQKLALPRPPPFSSALPATALGLDSATSPWGRRIWTQIARAVHIFGGREAGGSVRSLMGSEFAVGSSGQIITEMETGQTWRYLS